MPALHHLPAPAKINLFLHVVGRRPDGYHLLQSVFALLDWCDTLHIETRSDGHIHRHDIGQALPAEDLCLKAARLLQARAGTTLGCDIHIDKQLPWGAGLGGGSSDAATVLLGLNQLWGLNWPTDQLADLALQLGADVPFFIQGQDAWVEGIGERLAPIDLAERARFAVLKPPVAVPTGAVFNSPLLRRDTPRAIVADFLADPFGFGRNDLQVSAEGYSSAHEAETTGSSVGDRSGRTARHQDVGGIQRASQMLEKAFGNSRMTGSGSAVFARVESGFDTDDAIVKLEALLATEPPAWSGRLCHGLRVHPLREWTPG